MTSSERDALRVRIDAERARCHARAERDAELRAMLSESVVGTDFAATVEMPIRPSFSIISEEQRPLKMMILSESPRDF